MAKDKSYQHLKAELDKVLVELDANTDDIDKAIAQYKKGIQLLGDIEKYLGRAKAKIDILKPPK